MRHIITGLAIAATMGLGSSLTAQAATPAPPTHKISSARAMSIAAHKLHGKATKATFEYEDGRWQYGVLVTRGSQMYEVEVSTTGKVLDTEKTSASEESKEAASENKAGAAPEANEKGEKD